MTKRHYHSGLTERERAEKVGEAHAYQVLNEHFGSDVFIGSSIEIKLHELSHVIYRDVDDEKYQGATVTYTTGEVFVVLNTHLPLRTRYFTATHELWHVLKIKDMINNEIDEERAADRFAAALMMPEPLVRSLWDNLVKDIEPEKAVIMIADMSSAPYEAVARRVFELDLPNASERMKNYKEQEWIAFRQRFNLPESPLDRPLPFVSFAKYAESIENEIAKGELDHIQGATKLANSSIEKAKELQAKAMDKMRAASSDDEEEEDKG
ncbi:ImmA/IrrE family metallo-endopeptidase [Priestia megaterium]|uniref:ImmA/IrrE family metallo-endopeptidase n=1 Tax=Priestia megaterium TaxID=1404 RepID=UPI00207962CD|nr:ImmA/IrrE family metallo-endopeptidase [Priestia megaterium]USL45891.1 ImmA/IrrE family metallo-endopeptidase [Priestia megaterium]